jgi:hypothetical protein
VFECSGRTKARLCAQGRSKIYVTGRVYRYLRIAVLDRKAGRAHHAQTRQCYERIDDSIVSINTYVQSSLLTSLRNVYCHERQDEQCMQ